MNKLALAWNNITLSLFSMKFFWCSDEIKFIISPKASFARNTRFSKIQYLFAIKLDTNRTNAFANSFIPWLLERGTCFPRPSFRLHIYNLHSFNIHRYLKKKKKKKKKKRNKPFKLNYSIGNPKSQKYLKMIFQSINLNQILFVSFYNLELDDTQLKAKISLLYVLPLRFTS